MTANEGVIGSYHSYVGLRGNSKTHSEPVVLIPLLDHDCPCDH
jgi:hypothetical protein